MDDQLQGSSREEEINRFIDDCHSAGLPIVETIKRVKFDFNIGLDVAKTLVSTRPCWSRLVEASRPLHEAGIEVVKRLSRRHESIADGEFFPSMYFSYGQFMVFDQAEQLPACDWTNEHVAQGFARRPSTVCVRTLVESGEAVVHPSRSPYLKWRAHMRVIAVPFLVVSGIVLIEGPEERDTHRAISLPAGNYRLVVAQAMDGDDGEIIELFFEPLSTPMLCSELLVCDAELNPPSPLIETASVAG